jgi:nucleoside-diphosphate-sugar epimerase
VIGRTFNSGSNQEISVKDLVLTIASVMGRDVAVELDPERIRPAGSEVMRLLADTSELRRTTDWAPAVSLTEGLRRTAEWFAVPANLARYKTDIYNV